ncbi:MAG: archaeosortase/exosortase family protein [Puniceicoccales bacterium]|nr:archaeosortase/exosortase family protein [Puniceicoccales bacterium]
MIKLIVASLPDAVFSPIFCKIPAWIAASYFQAGLDGDTLVFTSGQMVSVTRACGGSDFFALLCAMLSWEAVPERMRRLPALLAGAWAVTMFVNGMRVVTSVWTRWFAEAFLPERMDAATHLVSGVLVFFPSLLAVWWLPRLFRIYLRRKDIT